MKRASKPASERVKPGAKRAAKRPPGKQLKKALPKKVQVGRPTAHLTASGPGEPVPADVSIRPLRSARLAGGDVDADLERVASSGEEAVGGSEPTPDQDVVDEIGDALGVGRKLDAQVIMSSDMLAARDRRRAERRRPAEDDR